MKKAVPDRKTELWKLFTETGDLSVYIHYASLKNKDSDKAEN